MAQKDIVHKVPLHTLKSTDEVRDLYDDWSKNDKYNHKTKTKMGTGI